jgi:hypothetical protein
MGFVFFKTVYLVLHVAEMGAGVTCLLALCCVLRRALAAAAARAFAAAALSAAATPL